MIIIELKKVEEGIVPIYESDTKEKLINARELHKKLNNKRQFANWIKQRIDKYKFLENHDFVKLNNFVMVGNLKRPQIDYYLTIDMAKELCMVENNETGRKIRRYFIEVEKRYREIINTPTNIFDFLRLALNQIELNSKNIENLQLDVNELKSKIDVKIKNNYCLASDIAEQLNLYSENNIPHSNLIGAIARQLGYKISYKHYYEDEHIAVVKDISKNEYWQVYFKPKAVEEIQKWFNENKKEIYYEIQYVRNTKNGNKKGEIKERGYKIENVCYKVYYLKNKQQ